MVQSVGRNRPAHFRTTHENHAHPIVFGIRDHVQFREGIDWWNFYLSKDGVREHAMDANRRAIVQPGFPQLLRGSAESWWAGEISSTIRRECFGNLEITMERILEGFKLDTADALNQLKSPQAMVYPIGDCQNSFLLCNRGQKIGCASKKLWKDLRLAGSR